MRQKKPFFLVHWENYPKHESTWEPLSNLKSEHGTVNEKLKTYCTDKGLETLLRWSLSGTDNCLRGGWWKSQISVSGLITTKTHCFVNCLLEIVCSLNAEQREVSVDTKTSELWPRKAELWTEEVEPKPEPKGLEPKSEPKILNRNFLNRRLNRRVRTSINTEVTSPCCLIVLRDEKEKEKETQK